jgi:hypothetical protein
MVIVDNGGPLSVLMHGGWLLIFGGNNNVGQTIVGFGGAIVRVSAFHVVGSEKSHSTPYRTSREYFRGAVKVG